MRLSSIYANSNFGKYIGWQGKGVEGRMQVGYFGLWDNSSKLYGSSRDASSPQHLLDSGRCTILQASWWKLDKTASSRTWDSRYRWRRINWRIRLPRCPLLGLEWITWWKAQGSIPTPVHSNLHELCHVSLSPIYYWLESLKNQCLAFFDCFCCYSGGLWCYLTDISNMDVRKTKLKQQGWVPGISQLLYCHS